MTSTNFVYWLQGWFEIQSPGQITLEQIDIIKNHINLVKRYSELKPYNDPISGTILWIEANIDNAFYSVTTFEELKGQVNKCFTHIDEDLNVGLSPSEINSLNEMHGNLTTTNQGLLYKPKVKPYNPDNTPILRC